MEIHEPCLEWVSYIPGTTVKEYLILSQNIPLGTGLIVRPNGIGCHRSGAPIRIGPGAYGIAERKESRDASIPHGNT